MRALFPGAGERVYLNIAAKGLIPTSVQDAVHSYLDDSVAGSANKDHLRDGVEATRATFARLIGADADEVAITKNVSEGLNLIVASLPWKAGDNVVISPELEHPNNIYLWYNLERRHGVEVRAVEASDGAFPTEGMVSAMDDRTRAVTFPTISFAPGFLTESRPIVRRAREVGAVTVADAAQSVGVVETDVRALGFDALAVATQKCLLSLYGYGFLYVRREVAESLVPIHVARYGVALDAHETAYSDGPLEYAAGARRFDLGNYNYLGMTATRTALRLIEDVGVERIEAHVRRLARRLAEGLDALGVPVVGGPNADGMVHVVSAGRLGGGRHYTADDPEINALHARLTEAGVVVALRSGIIRFSFGLYNDDTDVDRVLQEVAAWNESKELVR